MAAPPAGKVCGRLTTCPYRNVISFQEVYKEAKTRWIPNIFSKTEELRVNTISQCPIMLTNKAIRRVYDFTELGSTVSEDGGT
jgi:hypothetical protein